MKSLLPNNVYAGENSTIILTELLKEKEISQVVVFTDKGIAQSGLLDYLIRSIPKDVEVKIIDNIAVEPSYLEVQKSINEAADSTPGLVIGLGGGSVIDTAKLFSIIYNSNYSVKDLLDGKKIDTRSILSLMIPTTCGTGAEATINSIVAVPEKEVKIGIVNDQMIPDFVVLDPYYIKNLPKHILASSAVDAFCHGIECFTSVKANLISDVYAKACCELIFNNLEKVYTNQEEEDSRLSLLIGSFFGGLAITSSGTTAVHALSYPLGGKYHIPHGVSNAILLANVLKLNHESIIAELCELSEYLFASKLDLTKMNEIEKSNYLIQQVEKMIDVVNIPRSLEQWNVTEKDIDFLVESALQQRRLLDNNKKDLTYEDVKSIYLSVIEKVEN